MNPTPLLPTRRPMAALLALALASVTAAGAASAQAPTPAFTYQGELRLSSGPATAPFDMQFRLFSASSGGTQIGATITATSVAVSGGLFSVPLDFGPAQFAGDRQWLEIAIRPAGGGAYETLSPRTELTAAPYAWGAAVALANSVTTTSIVDGTIGAADINAAQVQRRVNAACQAFEAVRAINEDGSLICNEIGSGSVTLVQTGAGLTGGPIVTSGTIAVANGGIGTVELADGGVKGVDVDPGQVQRRVTGTCGPGQYMQTIGLDGEVGCGTDAIGPAGWTLSGNAGTNPATNFIGTTDAQAFVIRTRNARSLRIEPSSITFGTPALPITTNTIGGSHANAVTVGVRGATIAGGGVPSGDSDPDFFDTGPNRVTDAYGTVGGGLNNQAGDEAGTTVDRVFATVGGGRSNTASGTWSTVGGGGNNTASGTWSTVGGGGNNTASGTRSFVGGGDGNTASGTRSTVGGGWINTASGLESTVGGGLLNCAGGDRSWAGGTSAKVRTGTASGAPDAGCGGVASSGDANGDEGTFAWADSQNADFVSSGPNQFLVRADGGFGLNTNTIPAGIEAVLQGRTGPNPNVDLYLKPSAHGRGINLAMLPGAGAAEFRVAQYDGTSFTDRILLASNGDFSVTAQAFKPGGGSWAVPSDARLKSEVAPLKGTLERLLALQGVEYAYRPDMTPKSMYLPGRQIGFIAQEVEQVFPDWVSETDGGYKTVGPRGFEALAVEALRELRAESATIDGAQSQRIAALEAENASLRAESAELRAELDRRDAAHRDRFDRLEARLAGRGIEER